ncbi:hypothetical protein ACTQ5X_02730 [Jeotgalibaca porci]|uniref:hypothetical protein n=1 Tax=Jeotgalibaca porci TaxID=1868793 RepID=UPI003F92DC68
MNTKKPSPFPRGRQPKEQVNAQKSLRDLNFLLCFGVKAWDIAVVIAGELKTHQRIIENYFFDNIARSHCPAVTGVKHDQVSKVARKRLFL